MLSAQATRRRRPRRTARRGLTLSWSPDVAAATVAMLGLAFLPMLGSVAALLFLMGGAALMVTGPDSSLRAMRREWLLMLMALWCVTSFIWSDYAGLTLRHGIQLLLTVIIAIVICQRIAPTTLLKIVLGLMFAAGAVSLASGNARADGMGFLGIYASKNALAAAMGLLFLAALATLLDRRMPRGWRWLALVGAGLGLMLLVMGQSAGALIAVIVSVASIGPIMLLQRLPGSSRLVTVMLALVLFASAAVMLSTMLDQMAALLLDVTGKDVTLTGRTDLWAVAFAEIAQRPLLGAGFQAVWVPGNPVAEDMWAMFGIAGRSGFHFHNTLISNAVEIGLLGIALQAAIFFAALWYVLVWAIRAPSAPSLFLALFMVRQAISMGVEVVFFFQFDVQTVLTVAALTYGRSFVVALRAQEAARAPVHPVRRRIAWRRRPASLSVRRATTARRGSS